MRILHLIPRYPYFGGDTIVGGAASALRNLVQEQTKDHAVTLVAQMPEEGLQNPYGGTDCRLVPLHLDVQATSLRFGAEYTLKAPLAAHRLGRKFDLVHGHSGHLDYVLATLAVAKVLGTPAVHTLYCPATLQSKPARVAVRLGLHDAVLRHVSAFIGISENVAASLGAVGVGTHVIRMVHPAVDLVRYAPRWEKEEAQRLLGQVPPGTPTVLFVGNTKAIKNLEALLDAMVEVVRAIPDARLVITTELNHAETAREGFLMERIRALALDKCVIRLGILPNMPLLMSACDVLVAPFLSTAGISDYFMAALEAMSVGRPVIVSSVGGMPEIVDDSIGYLTDPRDARAIAAAILELLRDPEKRARMGRAARARVVSCFAPESVARQIEAVYREVLA